jgi:hypothetical protein
MVFLSDEYLEQCKILDVHHYGVHAIMRNVDEM